MARCPLTVAAENVDYCYHGGFLKGYEAKNSLEHCGFGTPCVFVTPPCVCVCQTWHYMYNYLSVSLCFFLTDDCASQD